MIDRPFVALTGRANKPWIESRKLPVMAKPPGSGLQAGRVPLLLVAARAGAEAADDAARIARGHAWKKHAREFPELKNADEFAQHVDDVIRNPTAQKSLPRGRSAYYDQKSNTVVIRDPKNPDGGTAFRPSRGRAYFDALE